MATTLYYIADYSHREIAELLGLPAVTVRKRVQLARRKLKERMFVMAEQNRPSQDDTFAERVMDLIKAAGAGDTDKVATLLTEDPALARAREPYEGHHGSSALHVAKTAEVAQLLIDHGADVNQRDTGHQSTPLTWAVVGRQDPALIDTLRKNGAEPDIYTATWLGDLDKVRQLLDQDSDLAWAVCPFPDLNGGQDALHIAAALGHADIVRLLLERGADPKLRRVIPPDGNQSYALDALGIAKRGDKTEVIALLS